MAERKLTTAEILAQARGQDAGGSAEAPSSSDSSAPEPAAKSPPEQPSAVEESSPAAEAGGPPPTFAGRPGSTADILAAARAETGQGGAKPAAAKPDKAKPAEAASKPPAASKSAAASGPRPSSTKDILAAARAQAGTAVEEKPAAKPAGKPAKSAKPAAKAPSGERPSVQEMLKAVRAEKPSADGEKPKRPPLPEKPARARVRPEGRTRRNFLLSLVATPFAAAWTSFAAASVAATLGFARFMLPNVIVEPPSKFKIGPPDDYPPGTVSTKWKAEHAIWVTHQIYNDKSEIYVLATICTHLGCTPNWLQAEQKFKCPCHGSGFRPTGINFEGPAPRPLERYALSLAPDGMLEVDKGAKFQEELGQWKDPASYVTV